MWFLAIGYFLTEEGSLCSDNGNIGVMEKEKCKEAAEELNKNWYGTGYFSTNPKGCYASGSGVFFNRHSTGNRQDSRRQMCKHTGKLYPIS